MRARRSPRSSSRSIVPMSVTIPVNIARPHPLRPRPSPRQAALRQASIAALRQQRRRLASSCCWSRPAKIVNCRRQKPASKQDSEAIDAGSADRDDAASRVRCCLSCGARRLRCCRAPVPSAGEIRSRRRGRRARHARRRPSRPAIAAASRSVETLGFGAELRQRQRWSRRTRSAPATPSRCRSGRTSTPACWSASARRRPRSRRSRSTRPATSSCPTPGACRPPAAAPTSCARRSPRASPSQTPDPQVEVRRVAGDGATVSVMGGVEEPRRLSDRGADAAALGDAGARRRRRAGARRGADQDRARRPDRADLAAGPLRQPALRHRAARRRPDHRRGGPPLVHRARRHHRPGAGAVQQARHVGARGDRHASAASTAAPPIRAASSSSATSRPMSPTACSAATTWSGRSAWPTCSTSTEPEGLFAAREFIIRDEDTIYITEAALGSWTRVLAIVTDRRRADPHRRGRSAQ